MQRLISLLLVGCVLTACAHADGNETQPSAAIASASTKNIDTDSGQLEKELQGLNWQQFRSVVEAIPKLKADVDAYGPMGWQFVQANYTTYGWKKNIDKLDEVQKKQLAELIQRVKSGHNS